MNFSEDQKKPCWIFREMHLTVFRGPAPGRRAAGRKA
jgi:hypothetical protein